MLDYHFQEQTDGGFRCHTQSITWMDVDFPRADYWFGVTWKYSFMCKDIGTIFTMPTLQIRLET